MSKPITAMGRNELIKKLNRVETALDACARAMEVLLAKPISIITLTQEQADSLIRHGTLSISTAVLRNVRTAGLYYTNVPKPYGGICPGLVRVWVREPLGFVTLDHLTWKEALFALAMMDKSQEQAS